MLIPDYRLEKRNSKTKASVFLRRIGRLLVRFVCRKFNETIRDCTLSR